LSVGAGNELFTNKCTVKPLSIISEGIAKNKRMRENYSCGKEKVNNTCVKTMHAGTMHRSFTVFNLLVLVSLFIFLYVFFF
jgi:hypothetical protein